jgi:hypothetical protein
MVTNPIHTLINIRFVLLLLLFLFPFLSLGYNIKKYALQTVHLFQVLQNSHMHT